MTPEKRIQNAIRLALGAEECAFWRNNVGKAHLPDGTVIPYGLAVGSADLVGVVRGCFVALEVKVPGEGPEPEQIRWGGLVTRYGGIYRVVRSADEALAVIGEVGK